MNKRHVSVAALCFIVLAFVIKGYCVFQQVDYAAETLKSFLYLATALVAVIAWPFVFKIKI